MRAVLPNNLRYVPGSTKLYNTDYPNGVSIRDDYLPTDGIKIGNYKVGTNAYVRFTAEVVDNSLACGQNALVNWMRGSVNNITLQDYATVAVNKVCENTDTPNQLPNTGPEAIVGGIAATGSIVTAAGYYIASRRALR